jgi:vacuolar-type H+-ATPase subunit H
MNTDSIARIHEAEAEAEKILSEAQQRAATEIEKAKRESHHLIARIRSQTQDEASAFVDEAAMRIRVEAEAVLRRGEQEARALALRVEENFEAAVDLVLRKVIPWA